MELASFPVEMTSRLHKEPTMKRHYLILGVALLLCSKLGAETKAKVPPPAPAEAKKVWKLTLPDLNKLAGPGDVVPKDMEILSFNTGMGLDSDISNDKINHNNG